MLSFTYQFSNASDEVYLAYSVPYTYSHLMQSIDEFKSSQMDLYNSDNAVLDV